MIAHAEQGDGGVCAVVTGVQSTTHRQTPHTQRPGLTYTHTGCFECATYVCYTVSTGGRE